MRNSLRHQVSIAVLLSLLLAIAFASLLPGLDGPFLIDDRVNIQRTQTSSLDAESLFNASTWSTRFGGYARSVANLSFALTLYFGPGDAASFKYQNTLLHLLNGLLIFTLVRLLFRQTGPPERADWLALMVAAVWLLHPLQVSTVLYAVQRLVLLATLFGLLALLSYLWGRSLALRRPLAGGILLFGAVPLFSILAVLSKEIAVLLPLQILLIEWFVFQLRTESKAQSRLLRAFLLLFCLIPLLAGAVYLGKMLPSYEAAFASRHFTLEERLLTQPHVLAMYLREIAIPIPGQMSLFQDGFPVQRTWDAKTVALVTLYLALIVGAFALRKRSPVAGLAAVWFFACHLVEGNVLPLELAFEHRNYLALLGPAILIALAFDALAKSPKLRSVTPLLATLVIALLSLNTASRAFTWSDPELMLKTQAERRSDSPRVLSGMFAIALARDDAQTAHAYIHKAQALRPRDATFLLYELWSYCQGPEGPPAELIAKAEQMIRGEVSRPSIIGAFNNITVARLHERCPNLSDRMIVDLLSAHGEAPSYRTPSERPLGLLFKARILVRLGDFEGAEKAFREAIQDRRDLRGVQKLLLQQVAESMLEAGEIDRFARLMMEFLPPKEPAPSAAAGSTP